VSSRCFDASEPRLKRQENDAFDSTFGVQFRYLKVIKSVRLRVEAPFFNGSFVAFELC
jgi:hypothetical protein